jgi:hypothetical protein
MLMMRSDPAASQPSVLNCRCVGAAFAIALGAIGKLAFAAATFTPIPTLSWASAVSGDGTIVAGSFDVGASGSQPALWTSVLGRQTIGSTPAEWQGSASDITRDGTTVLANYPCFICQFSIPVPHPPSGQAVWSQSTGLSFTHPFDTVVKAFSPDNQTLLGAFQFIRGASIQPAYRTPGQDWISLGTLSDINNLHAGYVTGSSADNSAMVGFFEFGSSSQIAFRWTATNGLQKFSFPAEVTKSIAVAISDDGTTVAGTAELNGVNQVFRWTESGGMQFLGYPAFGPVMSSDGFILAWSAAARSTVVGSSTDQAYVWDAQNGVRLLQTILEQSGASVTNFELNYVVDISRDGTTFVGRGTRGYTEGQGPLGMAYIATVLIPEPSSNSAVFVVLMAAPAVRFRRRSR